MLPDDAAGKGRGRGRGRGGSDSGGTDAAPGRDREYVGAGFISGVVLLILLGFLLVALIAQNADPVTFNLLWWEAEVALAALILGTAVAAVLVSELVGLVWRRRRRKYRTLREHEAR